MLNYLLEDFQAAVSTLKNNKGRTILSLSGIVIGIACVITISTLGNSLKIAGTKTYADMNTCLISGMPSGNAKGSGLKINDSYKKKLIDEVQNIKGVYLANIIKATPSSKSSSLDNQEIRAVDYGWLEAEGLKLAYGTDFDLSAYSEGLQQIILGSQIAKWLFPEGNPIGKTVYLYISNYTAEGQMSFLPLSFKVKGVLEDAISFVGQVRLFLLIPRRFVQRAGFEADFSIIDVIADEQKYVSEIKKEMIKISDELAGVSDSLYCWTLEEVINESVNSINMITFVMGAIAALSLLVGGIGIMNIMIVTVTERKQEIGIRKAIGASKKNIISQFLAEATLLTTFGSLLGSLFGFVISFFLIRILKGFLTNENSTLDILFVPDFKAMFIAIIVSVFIGIFFGLYPAVQAANLDPLIALEEE